MSGTYRVKGPNTLYKVWGIITYVFAGLYGVGQLLIFVFLVMGSSWAGKISDGFFYDLHAYYHDEIQGFIILIILFDVLGLIIGMVIRLLAGTYLVRDHVRSKGALIAVSVFYFLMALGNLVWAVIFGKAGSVLFTLFYLFCMGWAIATGVFLILKQAGAVVGEHDGQSHPPYGPALRPAPAQRASEMVTRARGVPERELQACIEGLFGGYKGRRYILRLGECCRIGRDSGCDIQLHHSKVSRIHCAVRLMPDGRFEVTDHSYNGTFYENERLSNGVSTVIEAGGMLALGNADNVFSLDIC